MYYLTNWSTKQPKKYLTGKETRQPGHEKKLLLPLAKISSNSQFQTVTIELIQGQLKERRKHNSNQRKRNVWINEWIEYEALERYKCPLTDCIDRWMDGWWLVGYILFNSQFIRFRSLLLSLLFLFLLYFFFFCGYEYYIKSDFSSFAGLFLSLK